MSEQTLEATEQNTNASNDASPAEDVKENAVKAETEKETVGDESEGKPDKEEPKLTEAEKIRRSMQKRIDRQTAAAKALQERLTQIERENADYKAKAPKAEDEPKQEDFDSYDDWEKAIIEYRAEKKVQERLQQERERESQAIKQRQQDELRRNFEEKEATFRVSHKDYDEVAKEAADTMTLLAQSGKDITTVRDAVLQFDNPVELIYQLGQDPSVIEELVTMPPLKVMRELLKMESVLSASQKEDKKAPEPIKRISGKSGVKSIADMSPREILEEFKRK